MRWSAVLILLLAALGVWFTVWGPSVSRLRPEFGEPAEALTRRLFSDNPRTVANEVYDQASQVFQDSVLRDRFADMVFHVNQVYGELRGLEVTGEEQIESKAGLAIRVELVAEFERGRAPVRVSYIRRDEDAALKLLGWQLEIPEHLRGAAAVIVPTFADAFVPSSAWSRVEAVVASMFGGGAANVYAEADPSLRKEVPEELFLSRHTALVEQLGDYRRVLGQLKGGMSLDQTRARLFLQLEFDRGKPTARVVVTRDLAAPDEWKIAYFQVVMPSVPLPSRHPAELRPEN